MVRDLVRAHVASVLGYPDANDVDDQRAFKELGFDSMTAVQLRNRLTKATGMRLPVTLVFDYPAPALIADYLLAEVAEQVPSPADAVVAELDRLETALSAVPPDDKTRDKLVGRVQDLLSRLSAPAEEAEGDLQTLDAASDDELFDFINKRLGRPGE